jgi:hypothetical protein
VLGNQGDATTKPGTSGVWLSNGGGAPGAARLLPTDLPQRPVDIFMLIVARGCVEQYSCPAVTGRFTDFAASAIPTAFGLYRRSWTEKNATFDGRPAAFDHSGEHGHKTRINGETGLRWTFGGMNWAGYAPV